MKRPSIVLLTLMVAVAGCGPTIRYVYTKPDVAPEQRQRDESECERQAMVTVRGGYYGGSYERVDRDLFNRCMANRGYEIKEQREEGASR